MGISSHKTHKRSRSRRAFVSSPRIKYKTTTTMMSSRRLPQVCEANFCPAEEECCSSSDDTASITTRDSASIAELHQSLYDFDDCDQDQDGEDASVVAPFSVQIQRLEELLDSPENDLASLDRTNSSVHTDEFSFESEGRDKLRNELASAYVAIESSQQEQWNHHQEEQQDQQEPEPLHHQDEHEAHESSSESSFYDGTSIASPDECDVSGTWEEGDDCDKKVMKILSRANSLVGGGAETLPIPHQVSFEEFVLGPEKKRSKSKYLIILLLAFLLLLSGARVFFGSSKYATYKHTSTKLSSSRMIDRAIDLDMTLTLSDSVNNAIDDGISSVHIMNATYSLSEEGDYTPSTNAPVRTGAVRVSRFDVDDEEPLSAVKCNSGNAWVCSTRGGLARASSTTENAPTTKGASEIDDEDISTPTRACNHGNAFACSTRGGLVRRGSRISEARTKVFSGAGRFVSQVFRNDGSGKRHTLDEEEEEILPMASRVKLMAMASL